MIILTLILASFSLIYFFENFNHDLIEQTKILQIQSNLVHQTLDEQYTDIFRHIRTIDKNHALVEIKLDPKEDIQIFKLLLRNNDLKRNKLNIKEISISQIPLS